MLSTILLHPGNRLLNGGTSDFSLFGAQPSTTVGIDRPAQQSAGLVAFAPSGGAPADGDTAGLSTATGSTALYVPPINSIGADSGAGGTPGSGFVAIALPATTTPGGAAVPLATGSGSVAPASTPGLELGRFGSDTANGHDAAAGSTLANAFGAPALDHIGIVQQPAFALADALAVATLGQAAPLVDAVHADAQQTLDVAIGTIADVRDDVTARAEMLGDTAGAVTETTAGLAVAAVDDAAHALGDVAGTATDTAADVAGTATGTIEDTLATATPAVEGAAGVVHDAGAAVTGLTADVVEGGAESITATALPLVDTLAASSGPAGDAGTAASDVLAGADPAAGIATLTGMVGTADIFELPSDGASVVTPTATALPDELALDGDAVDPLLGTDHHLDLSPGDDHHGGLGL